MTPCRSDTHSNVNCAARPVVSLIERTSPSAVTMSAAKGAGLGDHQATLRILQGGREVAHAALYVFIKQ